MPNLSNPLPTSSTDCLNTSSASGITSTMESAPTMSGSNCHIRSYHEGIVSGSTTFAPQYPYISSTETSSNLSTPPAHATMLSNPSTTTPAASNALPMKHTDIAQNFAFQYYNMLHTSPESLHRFYCNDSQLIRRSDIHLSDSVSVMGQPKIDELLRTENPPGTLTKIGFIDSQKSSSGGLMIMIRGTMVDMHENERDFMQSVYLSQQKMPRNGWYIQNEIFCYLDSIRSQNQKVNLHSSTGLEASTLTHHLTGTNGYIYSSGQAPDTTSSISSSSVKEINQHFHTLSNIPISNPTSHTSVTSNRINTNEQDISNVNESNVGKSMNTNIDRHGSILSTPTLGSNLAHEHEKHNATIETNPWNSNHRRQSSISDTSHCAAQIVSTSETGQESAHIPISTSSASTTAAPIQRISNTTLPQCTYPVNSTTHMTTQPTTVQSLAVGSPAQKVEPTPASHQTFVRTKVSSPVGSGNTEDVIIETVDENEDWPTPEYSLTHSHAKKNQSSDASISESSIDTSSFAYRAGQGSVKSNTKMQKQFNTREENQKGSNEVSTSTTTTSADPIHKTVRIINPPSPLDEKAVFKAVAAALRKVNEGQALEVVNNTIELDCRQSAEHFVRNGFWLSGIKYRISYVSQNKESLEARDGNTSQSSAPHFEKKRGGAFVRRPAPYHDRGDFVPKNAGGSNRGGYGGRRRQGNPRFSSPYSQSAAANDSRKDASISGEDGHTRKPDSEGWFNTVVPRRHGKVSAQ